MNTLELERQINSPDSRVFEGTAAKFIPVDDDWGVKLLCTESERDNSYNNHVHCHDLGLAPMYGPKVTLMHGGRRYYGYLVEIVECADSAVFEYYGVEHNGKCRGSEYFDYCDGENYSDFLDLDMRWGNAWQDLRNRMNKAGVRCSDVHAGNWGITKAGISVWIDFDRCIRF